MIAARFSLSYPVLVPLFASIALVLALPSCKTKDTSVSSDPYVTNEEGGYNPYPGGGGAASSDSLLPAEPAQSTVASTSNGYVPQYEQAVPAPPPGFNMPGDRGSFQAAPTPPRKTSSSTSSSSSSYKPKTTASTYKPKPKTTVSSSKPKPKTTASTSKSKPKTVAKKPVAKKPASKTHTVVKGDTLYAMALRNKTTVAKIKAANGLSSDKLSLGQKIKVP
jgi:LysM repeat protein